MLRDTFSKNSTMAPFIALLRRGIEEHRRTLPRRPARRVLMTDFEKTAIARSRQLCCIPYAVTEQVPTLAQAHKLACTSSIRMSHPKLPAPNHNQLTILGEHLLRILG